MKPSRSRSMTAAAVLAMAVPLLLRAAEPGACPKPLDACVAEKQKLFEQRGVLGFFLHRNGKGEPESGTYVVQAAPPGYPAATAGLRAGDILLSMNDKDLPGTPWQSFEAMLEEVAVGQAVSLKVRRDGQERTLRLIAAKPPQASIEAWIGQHVRDHHSQKDYRDYLRRLQAGHSGVPTAPRSGSKRLQIQKKSPEIHLAPPELHFASPEMDFERLEMHFSPCEI